MQNKKIAKTVAEVMKQFAPPPDEIKPSMKSITGQIRVVKAQARKAVVAYRRVERTSAPKDVDSFLFHWGTALDEFGSLISMAEKSSDVETIQAVLSTADYFWTTVRPIKEGMADGTFRRCVPAFKINKTLQKIIQESLRLFAPSRKRRAHA
jgi:hypothetical protein